MTTPNRRAYDRAQERGAYAMYPGGGAEIRDFSVGGVMLDDDDPLRVGSTVNLEMHFGEDTLYCEGIVRRCEPRSGMAVQFQRMTLPTRENLSRRVARAHEEAGRQRLAQKLDASILEYRSATRAPSAASSAPARPPVSVRHPLGQSLVRLGVINEDQLTLALALQRRLGTSLVTALVSSEIVGEEDLVRCLERSFRLPIVDLATLEPTREALKLISHEMASRHSILPIGIAGSTLTVAIADPANHDGLQQVKFASGCDLRPVLAPARSLAEIIDRAYSSLKRAAS